MDKKLGIIVPYRDRYEQLLTFKTSISEFLKDIDYELIIVEQDDAKIFNRGKLLNIGFIEAKKLKCDYVVFHDVDMIPVDVDYSYNPFPIHLATNFIPDNTRIIFDEYFGGVTLFPVESFEMINGYSNEYWGWGFEDTDLLYRCKINNINLDKKELIQSGGNSAALKFNGYNSYVKSDNLAISKNDGYISFFISFFPSDLTLNHEKYDDEFVIFSTNSLKIKYNSYQRYVVELKNKDEEYTFINSTIKPPYKTNICVTIDLHDRKISMYQDGLFVGSDKINNDFEFIQDYFYLGCDNQIENFFDGLITTFAVYNGILNDNEIVEISKNQYFGLTHTFGDYTSEHLLKIYYDCKFIKNYKLINLVGPRYIGEINNCETVGFTFDDVKIIEVPHRRNSTFKLLEHEENGFINGGWKNITTRYNQLKYNNEVIKGFTNTNDDGLNNCHYTIHSLNKINNLTHIVVGI
jgi:hypothetical protein